MLLIWDYTGPQIDGFHVWYKDCVDEPNWRLIATTTEQRFDVTWQGFYTVSAFNSVDDVFATK